MSSLNSLTQEAKINVALQQQQLKREGEDLKGYYLGQKAMILKITITEQDRYLKLNHFPVRATIQMNLNREIYPDFS